MHIGIAVRQKIKAPAVCLSFLWISCVHPRGSSLYFMIFNTYFNASFSNNSTKSYYLCLFMIPRVLLLFTIRWPFWIFMGVPFYFYRVSHELDCYRRVSPSMINTFFHFIIADQSQRVSLLIRQQKQQHSPCASIMQMFPSSNTASRIFHTHLPSTLLLNSKK